MIFEECTDVHTTRPRQVLSHAHMCEGGKCHVQHETQQGLTKLRKNVRATMCTVYTLRRVHDIRSCLYAKSDGNSTLSQSVSRCVLKWNFKKKKNQVFATHQLKSEPVDHLLDVI